MLSRHYLIIKLWLRTLSLIFSNTLTLNNFYKCKINFIQKMSKILFSKNLNKVKKLIANVIIFPSVRKKLPEFV